MHKRTLSVFLLIGIFLNHSNSYSLAPSSIPGSSTRTLDRPLIPTTSPLLEKGNSLDRLALDFFNQKQNKHAQALQAQEEMIQNLAKARVRGSIPRISTDPIKSFGNFLNQFSQSLLPQKKLPEAMQNLQNAITITPERLEQEINQALELLPTDEQIQRGTILSAEHVMLAGKVINALAVQSVNPIGFRTHHPSCNNVILKYSNDAGQYNSAISDYFSHIPYKDSATHANQAVEALVKVHQGIRCISNQDLSSVDASISAAILDLYYRLLKTNKTQVARAVIDSSLPLTIVLFDASKYFQIPQSSRVFCLPKELSNDLSSAPASLAWQLEPNNPYGNLKIGPHVFSPALGASLGSSCDLSLMRLLLEDPANEAHSTLKLFGIWAENPFDLGRPLNKVNLRSLMGPALTPFSFIQHMVDLRNWGEGDCSLHEWANSGGSCRSLFTCQMMNEINNSLPQIRGMLGSGYSIGSGVSGASRLGGMRNSNPAGFRSTPTPSDGAPGSPNTLFGISRSDVSSHCGGRSGGGGGAGGQAACGITTGSQRLFSTNPEMNRLMQCVVESTTGNFSIQSDLFSNPVCKLKLSLDDTNKDPQNAPQNRSQEERDQETREANRREAAERIRRETDDLANRLYAELTRRGYEVRGGVATVRAAIESRTGLVERAEFGDIEDSEDAWGLFDESRGGGTIVFDSAHALEGGEEFYRTAVHELLHATIEYMGWQGYAEVTRDEFSIRARGMPALDHRVRSEREEHSIIRRLGYQQCDPDSPSCNNNCGYADMRIQRFENCISQGNQNRGRSIGDSICSITPDLCGDGRGAEPNSGSTLGDSCFGSIDIPQQCLLVSCDSSVGISVPGCCSAGGSSSGTGGSSGSGSGVAGPGTPGFWDSFCNASPDRCGDRRGGTGDLPGQLPGGGSGPLPPPGGPEGGSPLP